MKKILTILLTVLMLIGVFVMPVSVEADSYEWKTAFNNEINRAKQTYPDAYYWIIDFDNNGIPELIYDTRTGIGGVRLLHYNGQSYASYFLGVGELRQNKNKFYSLNTHMGVGTYTVFEFTNGKTNKVFYGYYSSDTGRIKNPNEYRYYIKVSNKTTQVSRSDFYNKLYSLFNMGTSTSLYNLTYYNAVGAKNAIANYEESHEILDISYEFGAVNIKVDKGTDYGVQRYQVARKKEGENTYTYFTSDSNYIKDTNVVPSTKYTYQVRKYDYSTGKYGKWSKSRSITIGNALTLSLSNKSNGIRAEWNDISGAVKYIVYYKKTGASSWSSVTTSNRYYPFLNFTPGTNYSIQVQSVRAGNEKGGYSSVKKLTYIPQVKPRVSLSNKSNGIRAEWNAAGASSYIVYYKKTGDSKWSSVETKNTYYPLLGITAGTNYSVQVQPVSGGAKGPYSSVAKLTYIPQVKPAVTLSNKSNGIRAEWKSIAGATRYTVYFKKTGDSKWSSVQTANTYYPLLKINPGTNYSVQVQPVFNGANGLYSAVAKLTYQPTK